MGYVSFREGSKTLEGESIGLMIDLEETHCAFIADNDPRGLGRKGWMGTTYEVARHESESFFLSKNATEFGD